MGIDWGGVTGQYTINPGSDSPVSPNTEYTLNGSSTGSGAMYFNVTSTSHNYVFKTKDAGSAPSFKLIVFQVQGTVQSISSVSKSPASVYPAQAVTVTATLSNSLATGQGVYLRYTTDGWSSSSVVSMSGSGTTYTGTIPTTANTAGTAITYYTFTSGNGLTISPANADWYTINLNNNGGANYSYTVGSNYTSAQAGNWNTAGTWVAGVVPASGTPVVIAHNITMDLNPTVSSLTINNGSTLTSQNGGGQTLTVAAGGTFSNNGGFTANDGTVAFAGAGTVNGSSTTTFKNLTLNGTLTLSTVPHIGGNLQLNSGNVSVAPIYDNGSTLTYNVGVGYNRFAEWNSDGPGTVGTTPGYPYNVVIAAGTVHLSLAGSVHSNPALGGALTINPSCTLTLDTLQTAVSVAGNITNNGTLILSTNPGGDIKTYGDVNFASGSTFTDNARAIFFLKNGTQTVTNAIGTILIPYVILGRTGGTGTTVQLNGTNLTCTAANGGNAISFTNSTDVIDINGSTVTIGQNGTSSTISGSGSFKGSSTSNMTIHGTTAALGTVKFVSGSQVLNNLTIDRTYSGNGVTLGSDLTVNGTASISNTDLSTGAYTLTLGPSATLTETSTNIVVGNVATTRNVAKTVNNQFGNIGVELSDPAVDLGSTAVTRVTGAAKGVSIKRYYKIVPAVNTGLNTTFVFHYNDRAAELNGITESTLKVWESTNDGTSWAYGGNGTVNTTANTVTTTVQDFLMGTSGFSEWTLAANGTLPVELTSFTANAIQGGVQVKWETATEINNAGFTVQRSTNNSVWEDAKFFPASGNSNSPRNYSFIDKVKKDGKYFYRLKQRDNDGTEKAFDAVEVTVKMDWTYQLNQNYPNPFNPATKISFSIMKPGMVKLSVFNAIGQVVKTYANNYSEAGTYSVSFDGRELPSGLYFFKMEAGNYSSMKKMMLVK